MPAPTGEPERAVTSFRHPRREDGKAVWNLVAACPPLDRNSLYCNLLQCAHFASTCLLAERDGEAIGWISAYRPPAEPRTLFVWQVAVGAAARGEGLGKRLVTELLASEGAREVEILTTTITRNNAPSWALFRATARALNAPFRSQEWLDRDRHFGGDHETEHLITIGPFATGSVAADAPAKNRETQNAL
jgi:L-2,4-diaminobutyric acid acetyltransferase